MNLTRDEVLERLCKTVSKVFQLQEKSVEAADCFCKDSVFEPYGKIGLNNYRFDDSHLDFIDQAVDEAIKKAKSAN